jgi:hypothetical protein
MDQHEYQAAWQAAFRLAAHLESGQSIPPMPPSMMLRVGEVQYGVARFSAMTYSGMDVEYNTRYVWGGGLFLSGLTLAASAAANANSKARAQNLSRPQWRSRGPVDVTVTSQRIAIQSGATWSYLDLNELLNIQVDVGRWSVFPTFDGQDPLLLQGPWAPWLGVVMSWVASGNPWPPGMPAVAAAPAMEPGPQPVPGQPALPSGAMPSADPRHSTGF